MYETTQLKNQAADMAQQGLSEARKSGEDWLNYVEKHPLQSMLFGTVIFFALKGLFK